MFSFFKNSKGVIPVTSLKATKKLVLDEKPHFVQMPSIEWDISCPLINSFFAYQKAPLYKSYSKIFPLTADGGDPLSSMKAQFGMSQQSNLSKYYNVNNI